MTMARHDDVPAASGRTIRSTGCYLPHTDPQRPVTSDA